jgi:glycerol-3-phosphate dehydrogenase
VAQTRASRAFLHEDQARRLVRAYGTRVERVLGAARSAEELGVCFGAGLTAAEVRYLMEREWAQTDDDVLWRRSKLGLRLSLEQREKLARFMIGTIGQRD